MRMLTLGAASAAVFTCLAATPASATEVVVRGYGPRAVYVHPYPYYRAYRPHWRYVAAGPHCWRSARVRFDGAVVYRRICA